MVRKRIEQTKGWSHLICILHGYLLEGSGSNLWTCAIGAPFLLLWALGSGQSLIPVSFAGWGLVIALGVISQATGQGFIVTALAHLPAGFSSVALLSAPVAAAIFAWAFLDEPISIQQLAGMAIVLFGIYMAQRSVKP